jgi:hypothetical protein
MKKEKLELIGKRREEDRSGRTKNRRNKLSNKDKILVDRECIEGLDLKKRVIIKNDGRYLIYYDF